MIPVLGIPVLNNRAITHRFFMSVDHDVDLLYVVDNGNVIPHDMHYERFKRIHVADLGYNAGVAASWNLIIRANMNAPWWLICNNDMILEKGSLDKLVDAMDTIGDSEPHMALIEIGNESWGNHYGAFAMNPSAVETLGWFDENYHPIYFEDTDYRERINRHPVKVTVVNSRSHHDGNASWKGKTALAQANAVSWAANAEYFTQKWGKGNKYEHDVPFGESAFSIPSWIPPSLSRLRRQAWPVDRSGKEKDGQVH